MAAKRRGNPNWGKPEPYILTNTVCSFDSLAKALKLSPEQYEHSHELKEWSLRNKDSKYVPQDLLQAWNFVPKTGL
jgi:hypothetical protein